MKYYYIVAAAGVGKRMGLNYPKQFLQHQGKEIFIKTLEVIENSKLVTDIIVVTNSEYIDKVSEITKSYNISKVRKVVAGGKERQDSINNALMEIKEDAIIGVQDGVRPFIEDRYIEESYKEIVENGLEGVVVGVKVKDTIKMIDNNGEIADTPKREYLIAAQTPQVFRGELLKKAYKSAMEDNYLGTDDSSLVERIGGRVKIIEGSYENIKITTPEDLKFLENN